MRSLCIFVTFYKDALDASTRVETSPAERLNIYDPGLTIPVSKNLSPAETKGSFGRKPGSPRFPVLDGLLVDVEEHTRNTRERYSPLVIASFFPSYSEQLTAILGREIEGGSRANSL